ncbi:MAG: hypothetical protein IPI23_17485 [Bacteroidetes bacterium]|nr:hypothetical protein [Bacteroidota bacterium]
MSVFRAYNGWKSPRTFTPGDKKLVLFTLIFSHVQLLIGFVLYMVSPIVQSALADMGSAMKDKMLASGLGTYCSYDFIDSDYNSWKCHGKTCYQRW